MKNTNSLNIDEAIIKLKELEKELPNNLYILTSREEHILQEMLAIIRGMTIPEIIGNMYD